MHAKNLKLINRQHLVTKKIKDVVCLENRKGCILKKNKKIL